MSLPFSKLTPAQRAELVASITLGAKEQIEDDADVRAIADWMIESCGLTPSAQLYRLVLLSAVIADQGSKGER